MEGDFATDHLPFPMPSRKHTLSQEWRNLTFMHWEVDLEKLRPHVPEELEIDTFEGKAYIGVVPFMMKNVRPTWFVSTPFISTFPEFNIRTYVKKDGIAGVFFLTLEAKSFITCNFAPKAYGLPYRYAKGSLKKHNSIVTWKSSRQNGKYNIQGVTRIKGVTQQAKKGSLEDFLFERYSLYTEQNGKVMRGYTHHKKWDFQTAEVELDNNSLTESFELGIEDCLTPELVHYSEGVRVRTYSIEIAERIGADINRDFLFLDGDCGLCHRLATFVDRRMSKSANLGYRPNNSADAQRVIASMPQKFIDADTVYLIRNGKPYMKSSAAIRCLLYMKWYYRSFYPICWIVPLPIRNIAYSIVARFRHKIFKRPKVCSFRID
tara:strand:+ start:1933 stop:3063 length:1131 start_codon:yes stop_codon:yes gene_type:complete